MKQKQWYLKASVFLLSLFTAFSVSGAIIDATDIQPYNLTALFILVAGPITLLVISSK